MINISNIKGYEYSEVIGDGQTGEAVYVHPVFNQSGSVGVQLVVGSNSGKLQVTMSDKSLLEANEADWVDCEINEVDGIVVPVTALRGVSISGEITLNVIV